MSTKDQKEKPSRNTDNEPRRNGNNDRPGQTGEERDASGQALGSRENLSTTRDGGMGTEGVADRSQDRTREGEGRAQSPDGDPAISRTGQDNEPYNDDTYSNT